MSAAQNPTDPAAAASAGADAAPGATPAAAAPLARDDAVRRLEQRVAELERHLAEHGRAPGDAEPRRSEAVAKIAGRVAQGGPGG